METTGVKTMGRPSFEATEKDRHIVKAMAGVGCRHDDISVVLGITPKTLRKHFREELDRAAIEANAEVLQSLFRMATSGKNTAASIFWVKTRCGLRDKAVKPEQPKALEMLIVEQEAASEQQK